MKSKSNSRMKSAKRYKTSEKLKAKDINGVYTKSRRKKAKINKKLEIYKIITGIIVICIMINICNFYKSKKEREKIETSVKMVEENENNNRVIKEKPIDSNTTDWNLILINKDNLIPEDYKIETTKIDGRWEVDIRIKEAIEQMLADARKEGLDPLICSSYRLSEYQVNLFNKKVNEYKAKGYSQKKAEEQASLWVAIPRTSEHEIGLSLDIVSNKYQVLDEKQESTAVQKWLMEHCYDYGFILRYPTDKKEITKINYEPWHYRYVGVKDAMFMKEKGFCLEEYIEFLKEYED